MVYYYILYNVMKLMFMHLFAGYTRYLLILYNIYIYKDFMPTYSACVII